MRLKSFPCRGAGELAVAMLVMCLAGWGPTRAVARPTGAPTAPSLPVQRVAGGSNGFDGTWLVLFSCPGAWDGTAGYTRRFLAAVQNGTLHGEIGVRNQASYLALDGTIQPDGSALLTGAGMTGNAEYAVGRPSSGTPYRFTLQTRFDGAHGIGHRVETRTCDAVFTRQ